MRLTEIICLAVALVIGATAARSDTPRRVVSINLCTDQLALAIAAPGQLISVSRLAHDPVQSSYVEAANTIPANGGRAEEIYLLKPDLVLAGTFTDPATLAMLAQLGIPVATFPPATALNDIPAQLRRMGELLGRRAAADTIAGNFDTDLAALRDDPPAWRPRAAFTYVNAYSSGDRSLAGDMLHIAGFENVATEAGIMDSGRLPLETLVLLSPDLVIRGRNYPGAARAEDTLRHPALAALEHTRLVSGMVDRDWVCGTPRTLDAVRRLKDLRHDMEAAR